MPLVQTGWMNLNLEKPKADHQIYNAFLAPRRSVTKYKFSNIKQQPHLTVMCVMKSLRFC